MFNLKHNILPIIILILLGVAVYSFNLNNGLFWDDEDWIVNNTVVHGVSWDNIKFWLTNDALAGVGLESNYYRPFLFLTFAINYVVSGAEPFIYHLTSNIIHIFNAVLVFVLLKRFDRVPKEWESHSENLGPRTIASGELRDRSSKRSNLVAFLTALIFLIHPLNTEAVTYISGRGDPLSVFFMLLALWLWMNDFASRSSKVVDNPHERLAKSFMWITRPLSLLALVLAILSRETGIIFPFLLMVFYVAFLHHGNTEAKGRAFYFVSALKSSFKEALPYFGVVAIYGILRLTALNFQNTLNFYTAPNLYSENLIFRLFTFMHVLVDYFRLLFVQTGLHMERSMVVHTSLFQWPVWLGALIVAAVIFIGFIFYKNSRIENSLKIENPIKVTSGPQRDFTGWKLKIKESDFRIWFFGWGWFFIALGPVSGITPINALMYEHWLYLPMIGFWLIVSYYLVKLLDYLSRRSASGKRSRPSIIGYWSLVIGLAVYFSFFAYQSIQRNILWGDGEAFYKDILKYEPNSLKINNNLGNLYFNQGDIEQAEVYYRRSIEAGDEFAQPYFNLGSILQSRGDIDGAIRLFEKAIEVDPGFYYPYQNLAVIYAQQGDLIKAADNIEKLKRLIPGNPRVYYNSALVYIALNDKEQALADLNEGLKFSKFDPETGRLIEELIRQLRK